MNESYLLDASTFKFELSSLEVPETNWLNSTCDKSVKTIRFKGYTFYVPILFMKISDCGDDLGVKQVDQHDTTLSLLSSEAIDNESVVIIGNGHVDDLDDL